MIKVYIVEDNLSHLELLKLKVEMLGYEVSGFSQSVDSAMVEIQRSKPDVALVDINLNRDRDGITLAHVIKEFTDTSVIFITSQNQDEVITDAVTAKPAGYLIKPVDPAELKATIELAYYNKLQTRNTKRSTSDFLTVRTGDKLQVVSFKNIKLLRVDAKNYVTLVDESDKQFVVRDSLKSMLGSILPEQFIRTHHSFGVNMDYVAFIDDKEQTIYLSTNDAVPIGKSYRKEVYERLNIKN